MTPAARQVEILLRAAAEAAAARAPLGAALRLRAGNLGATVATALDGGADLRAALHGALPAWQLDLLAGPRPPLDQAALMVAEDIRLARERRWRWVEILGQPALSLAIVLAYALIAGSADGAGLALSWLLVAAPATALVIIAVVIGGRPGSGLHLPWLGALGHHARQAGRYERAALCARWQLPEELLVPWLGADLAGLGPVLARADAQAHCRRLAAWHRAATVRAQNRLGRILAVLLALIAGCLILATATPVVQRTFHDVTTGFPDNVDGTPLPSATWTPDAPGQGMQPNSLGL